MRTYDWLNEEKMMRTVESFPLRKTQNAKRQREISKSIVNAELCQI